MGQTRRPTGADKVPLQVQIARVQLAKAETRLEAAKERSRAAKRRRKAAKEAARQARKEVKKAKADVAVCKEALVTSEASLATAGAQLTRKEPKAGRSRKAAAPEPRRRKVPALAEQAQPVLAASSAEASGMPSAPEAPPSQVVSDAVNDVVMQSSGETGQEKPGT